MILFIKNILVWGLFEEIDWNLKYFLKNDGIGENCWKNNFPSKWFDGFTIGDRNIGNLLKYEVLFEKQSKSEKIVGDRVFPKVG